MPITTFSVWWWVGFNAFVLLMLALDLGIFNRKAHVVKPKEAAIWTAVWVTISLLFCGFIFKQFGSDYGWQFLTGYLIEYSLSVDNLFVFVLIFGYFSVPAQYQHRILFWGIIGALIMRITLILAGNYLIEEFHWVIYIFGAFLIYTGVRMAIEKEGDGVDPEANPILVLLRRWLPVTNQYHGQKFLIRENGRLVVTPLLVVLVLIESTDLIFALDSIPATFAVSRNIFIIYTSNILAILGLRSLYFLLSSVIDKFHLLKYGLAVVLAFIGAKMVLDGVGVKIDILVSLGVVVVVLASSIVASLVWPKKEEEAKPEAPVRFTDASLDGDGAATYTGNALPAEPSVPGAVHPPSDP